MLVGKDKFKLADGLYTDQKEVLKITVKLSMCEQLVFLCHIRWAFMTGTPYEHKNEYRVKNYNKGLYGLVKKGYIIKY